MRISRVRKSVRISIALLVSFCVCERPASAQKPEDVRLSLQQAIEMTFANNKDITLAKQNALMADFDLKGVISEYEARSTFSSSYEHTKLPVNSFLSGGVNGSVVQSDLMAGYHLQGWASRGGGNYEVNFASHRFTTNNIFAALNPQFPSDLLFRFTQPLVRGRNFSTRLKDIEIAKKNLRLSDTDVRKIATDMIVNVKTAYWDLVVARSNMTIQEEILRDTRARLDVARNRASTGLLAVSDVSPSEARAAESEQISYRALDEVTRAENALKNLIAETADSNLWDATLVPTDGLDSNVADVSLQDAVATAMENRVELEETDIVNEINEIEQRYFRDQVRSQVDVVGSYGLAGLGGSAAPLIRSLAPAALPTYLEGGYGQSLTNLVVNRFNTVRVGVEIALPLHNHEADSKLGRALVENQRLNTQREKLKQLIQVDVRNAYQSFHLAQSQPQAASLARVALEQQHASQQRRSNVGYSSSDVVLAGQIELAAARLNEQRAQAEHNKAWAQMERAMGTTLEANRIEIRSR